MTSEFPIYDLRTVEKDIRNKCKATRRDLLEHLLKLSHSVGGNTDILIGIKYFPKLIFETDTGLEILESVFTSSCGTRGAAGGPDQEFSKIERNFKGVHVRNHAYFTQSASLVRDISMLDNVLFSIVSIILNFWLPTMIRI